MRSSSDSCARVVPKRGLLSQAVADIPRLSRSHNPGNGNGLSSRSLVAAIAGGHVLEQHICLCGVSCRGSRDEQKQAVCARCFHPVPERDGMARRLVVPHRTRDLYVHVLCYRRSDPYRRGMSHDFPMAAPRKKTDSSQEVPEPGRNIPKVMCLTPVIGIATTLPFVVATLFATVDLGEVVRSELPILTLYHQATGSKDVTAIFTIWLIFNYFGGTVTGLAASGRMAWAFARDNGLPFSGTLATVHPRFQTPVASTVACAVLMALYGLIYIASSTAYSSIVSMAILSMNVTYVIPQGILLFRGREKVLVDRYFDLGRYGVFVNAFSCVWVGLYTVIFCFPTIMPPTPSNMNYLAPVVVVIVVLILVVWYGGKKKTFFGPVSMQSRYREQLFLTWFQSVVIAEALVQESSVAIVSKRKSSPHRGHSSIQHS